MIESDLPCIMSGGVRNAGQSLHPSQEYRLLASDPSQLSEDDLPSDLQSLSWLTSVDVPRLQQMASGRMDFSLGAQNALLQQTGPVASNMHSSGAPGAMIHVQASLPQGILGLNSISTHGANMSQYPVGGQPSPGLQTQQQLFPPPHSQQVFAIAQNTPQVLLFPCDLCLKVPSKIISRTLSKEKENP
ncbi:Forkhead box protein N4 isoform X2 [Aix galericulata]|nr:Forkhead box protein N4 isoform X2 [Aix galericulata]